MGTAPGLGCLVRGEVGGERVEVVEDEDEVGFRFNGFISEPSEDRLLHRLCSAS